jgi:hypothetical protein
MSEERQYPEVAVISSARYESEHRRVSVTVEPCGKAACFVVLRRFSGSEGPPCLVVRYEPATGYQQTFYDYTFPLESSLEYSVISYSEMYYPNTGEQIFFAALKESERAEVSTTVGSFPDDPA